MRLLKSSQYDHVDSIMFRKTNPTNPQHRKIDYIMCTPYMYVRARMGYTRGENTAVPNDKYPERAGVTESDGGVTLAKAR